MSLYGKAASVASQYAERSARASLPALMRTQIKENYEWWFKSAPMPPNFGTSSAMFVCLFLRVSDSYRSQVSQLQYGDHPKCFASQQWRMEEVQQLCLSPRKWAEAAVNHCGHSV